MLILPSAVELPESLTEVSISIRGNTRIISLANESWDHWFDNPQVTDDFMESREQSEDQLLESFE